MTSPLAVAVAGWCDPRRVKVLREPITDAGWWFAGELHDQPPDAVAGRWASMPPLVTDLERAVAPSGESGKGTGRGGSSVVDWDAVAILDGLRVTVADWTGLAGLSRRPDLPGGLRQLAVHGWAPDADPGRLARVLTRLAAQADAHLTPAEVSPTRYVRQDCPECGYRVVATSGGSGEVVRGFALVVEFNRGFVNSMSCQVCWAYWTRHQLEEWAHGLSVPA